MKQEELDLIKKRIESVCEDGTIQVRHFLALQDVLTVLKDTKIDKPRKTRKKASEAVTEAPVEPEVVITISCDASIKKNPGGPASVGVVIRVPGKKPVEIAKIVPANTNNEAEYDAVFEGLKFLSTTVNVPKHEVVVNSDSQLVVKQLLGEYKISDSFPNLKKRCEIIRELAAALPVPVKVEWKPRNSTPDLELANYLAQDAIGVPRK